MIPIKAWTTDIEPEAQAQLNNIASLPWVFKHVAVMPDVHYGKGATVGSVIAMKNAVAPAAVGVDIGCGMDAMMTNLTASDLPDSLREIRLAIEEAVPVGFNQHGGTEHVTMDYIKDHLMNDFKDLSPQVQDLKDKAVKQLGTLGGGNHFIELCIDNSQNVWLMLHSGSRNIGKTLAEIHISKAKALAHNQDLPDRDLAVFLAGTPEMQAYRNDLWWAQLYAYFNRETMMSLCFTALKKFLPAITSHSYISCHHNYVSEETHFGEKVFVTRKGAIAANTGDFGIIPGSMGAKSYIVKGLGNPDSFNSASHGAGRRMSRNKAKKSFSIADLEAQTAGVECRKDINVLDEIPAAYKNIDEVMHNQRDLVRVLAELKQVLCVKG